MVKKLFSLSTILFSLSIIGCGSDDAADSKTPGNGSSAGSTTTCKGTLSGSLTGAFNCTAVANYFSTGQSSSSLTGDRKNSIITILNNSYDSTHYRPDGVKNISGNFEVAGEIKAGTYTKAETNFEGTIASVSYIDGRYYNVIKDLTLKIDTATFVRDETSLSISSKVYLIKGSIDLKLTNAAASEEVGLQATF